MKTLEDAFVDRIIAAMNQPQTHDYTVRYWGHSYEILRLIDDGAKVSICGHGLGIRTGDFVIFTNKCGTTRYKVLEIEYRGDPNDMWFATMEFAPRQQSCHG